VVWCPKCKAAVGDHGRLDGEGATPEEVYLIKFQLDGMILPCATYRPETTYGVTNIWLNPDTTYVKTGVGGETWLVSRPAVQKMVEQGHAIHPGDEVAGSDLIGRSVTNPVTGTVVLVLPASFVDENIGSGVVMSVPAHAPFDYAALRDLQRDPGASGLEVEPIRKIKPIALIELDGYGEFPAVDAVEQMGIDGQDDPRLEDATREIYRKEFHGGKLLPITGDYDGLTVSAAKDRIVADFVSREQAVIFYELSEPVTCRCLTPCSVKIVSDQWFLNYSDPEWKAKVHRALDDMDLFPDKVRTQFHNVVDWLRDWACAREYGLGTSLPWDEKWLVESLSDSTIYMAYYTFVHYLQDPAGGVDAGRLGDAFFDYLLLGEGSKESAADESGCPVDLVERMRTEFLYWYPFDLRNSGKDLVQNHLTFCLFNHVAIFPEELWPGGISINGFLQLDGVKMSGSKGNVYTLRQMCEDYGADATRLTLMHGGEGLEDPNWDSELARSTGTRLKAWLEFACREHPEWDDHERAIDRWFTSVTARLLKGTREAMDNLQFRTALHLGFFEMQRHLRWYVRRSGGSPDRKLMQRFIEVQTLVLAPFAPHVCEEIWERLEGNGFISTAAYPEPDTSAIDPDSEDAEDFVGKVLEDVKEIIKVASLRDAGKVWLYVAPPWKQRAAAAAKGRTMGEAMAELSKDPQLKPHLKSLPKFVQKCVSDRIEPSNFDEAAVLKEAAAFLSAELGKDVRIDPSDDRGGKRDAALPGRPGIFIE